MSNFLQKWLYNLSAGAPLLIVFAVVWYYEKKTWIIPGICICAAILLTVLMGIAFVYCRRNLPPITINVTDVAPHDAWIVAYIFSYLFPFISMILDDCNLLLFVAICCHSCGCYTCGSVCELSGSESVLVFTRVSFLSDWYTEWCFRIRFNKQAKDQKCQGNKKS